MSILDRSSLEASPLADLHALASELSIDSFRRLRKAELIDAILARQGASPAGGAEEEDRAPGAGAEGEPADGVVEGVVEVLPGGSGFVRVNPPDPSDQDVYISAAQVRRCELISGDRVSGPRRPPRRSERFASLLRVDTVNGRPVAELGAAPRFEERPARFPSEPLLADSADPVVRAVISAAPIGRGSRVTIVGPAQSGKTVALRSLAAGLASQPQLELWVVLVGVRPEEIEEWQQGPAPLAGALALGASPDAQSQAVEGVVEQGRRVAARGEHAAVLIDTLDHLHDHVSRRALASARRLADGGSLTVIATASRPVGGETTVVGLDLAHAPVGAPLPVSPALSWTTRAELLVGEKQAEKLAKARARALHT
jgi:transcription termination factor Rho